MATERLLEEFPPVSTEAWEAAIARDLKGADYQKKLIWRTEEGLAVKPYYRAADLDGLEWRTAAPGAFPYLRGTRAAGGWQIREEIAIADPEEANQAAQAALAAGAEGIAFRNLRIENSAGLAIALANLGEIPVHLEGADETLMRLLLERLRRHPRAAETSTDFNPLTDTKFAAEVLAQMPAGLVPFTVEGAAFEEAGASAVEEIGFTLAAGVDYLAAMQEHGVAIDRAAEAIGFHFAMGANYFMQIAKLRAFRLLWARVVESFGGAPACARARIAARTSRWNETVYDPHVNILRATTEAMAAVVGGADAVTVAPFDECYKEPDAASRRLARNTQLLLKHEAHFARVADPGGGAYGLEAFTDFLASAGWQRMQAIQAQGGYRKAQATGVIAEVLNERRAEREKAVTTRRRVLTGTNQYANPAERALERANAERMQAVRRGAWMYEKLRLRTERHAAAEGKTPRVLLAEIGDVKMRGARAQFARNFFACAGFEIAARRFAQAGEIAAAEADVIVLCSADAEYAAITAELMLKLQALGRKTPVIVAGNPENAEELKAAGIADFVHIRSNPVDVLTKWQEWLGMKD